MVLILVLKLRNLFTVECCTNGHPNLSGGESKAASLVSVYLNQQLGFANF